MTERKVAIGLITFKHARGYQDIGYLGDVVDVHEADLERFDRRNKLSPGRPKKPVARGAKPASGGGLVPPPLEEVARESAEAEGPGEPAEAEAEAKPRRGRPRKVSDDTVRDV